MTSEDSEHSSQVVRTTFIVLLQCFLVCLIAVVAA